MYQGAGSLHMGILEVPESGCCLERISYLCQYVPQTSVLQVPRTVRALPFIATISATYDGLPTSLSTFLS